MSLARSGRSWWALSSIALASTGCAGNTALPGPHWQPTAPLVEPTALDDSMLCRSIAEHFIGLPTTDRSLWNGEGPPPAAGRWWVRRCSARARGSELEVELQGPGWYWVDESGQGFRLQQQVPFALRLTLKGRLRENVTDGVLSLWFTPSAEPAVAIESPDSLGVETTSAWGRLLRWLPGVRPAQAAAQRFKQELGQSFLVQARTGATFTYDLRSGQADSTLGQLEPGKTPSAALADEPTWIVNERLLLAPHGSQVLGPLEPGASSLNVLVERGPGVSYRAICEDDLRDHYAAIVEGSLSTVPAAAWRGGGTVEGLGERTGTLRVAGCRFFLVVTSASKSPTLAALRVRA